MTDEVGTRNQDGDDRGDHAGPPHPHTPPMGISAVRPGDPPPMAPELPVSGRRPERPAPNWLAAMVASGGVVLSLIGLFLPWTVVVGTGRVVAIGWDQTGVAVLVLLLGMAAAAATGAQWSGLRGLGVKSVLLGTGGVLLLLAGLEIGDVRSLAPAGSEEFRVGSGLLVLAIGSVLLLVAALLDRGPWTPSRG